MTLSTQVLAGLTAGIAVVAAAAAGVASPWGGEEEARASEAAATRADECAQQTHSSAVQARWRGGRGQGDQAQQGLATGGHGPGRGAAGAGVGGGQHQRQGDAQAHLPAATAIDEATVQELLYMAEEEKLAHDVYVALGETYEVRQFANIAQAELRHLDSVRVLLDRYDLDDPTVDAAAGEFTNAQLQKMYDDLVDSGSGSVAAAAQAGVTIEETDIADLTQAINDTDAADVVQVLTSLRDGSQRHLAAFERLASQVS
jgi:hypothetical protein